MKRTRHPGFVHEGKLQAKAADRFPTVAVPSIRYSRLNWKWSDKGSYITSN